MARWIAPAPGSIHTAVPEAMFLPWVTPAEGSLRAIVASVNAAMTEPLPPCMLEEMDADLRKAILDVELHKLSPSWQQRFATAIRMEMHRGRMFRRTRYEW